MPDLRIRIDRSDADGGRCLDRAAVIALRAEPMALRPGSPGVGLLLPQPSMMAAGSDAVMTALRRGCST